MRIPGAEGPPLEILDCRSELLHVVIEQKGSLVAPCDSVLGRERDEIPAELAGHGDGVVVMVVPDLGLGLVEGPAHHVLRHVDAGRKGVLGLYCVLTVAADPGPRVPEQQLLERPLPEKFDVFSDSDSRINWPLWPFLKGKKKRPTLRIDILGVILRGIIQTERTGHRVLLDRELRIVREPVQDRFERVPTGQVNVLIHVKEEGPIGREPVPV